MAWIDKRGNRFRVLTRVVEDGKKKVRQVGGTYATEAEAKSALHDVEHPPVERKYGLDPGLEAFLGIGKKGPKLADFARPMATGKKARTRRIRARALARIVADPDGYGERTLKELEKNPELTRKFLANKKDLGTLVGFLQLTFNQAIRDDKIAVSPMFRSRISRPTPKKKKINPLTIAEVKRLSQAAAIGSDRAAPNETLALTILIGAWTGLRGGEIGGLRPEDIDTVECTIHVRQQVSTEGREIIEPKTDASERRIAVPCSITAAIAEYVARHGVHSDGLIFHSAADFALTSDSLTKSLRPVAKRAGLRHVTEHDLRHANASILINLGWSPERIAKQFGHNDGGVLVMKTYAHLYERANRDLADDMQRAIDADDELKALPAGTEA